MCCLSGSFLFVTARVPPAGLRKENGKMKIKYEFATGDVTEIEVEDSIGKIILESRRLESNSDRKERYHCYSLDALQYGDKDKFAPSTDETPDMEEERREADKHLWDAFRKLSEVQQRRMLMLAAGMSMHQIAEKEGVNYRAVYDSITAARKKFLKYF